MEEGFGLNELSELEKNVLYAVKDLEKEYGAAKTGDILSHNFTSRMSRVSVFRNLTALEKLQKIERKSSKRGEYISSSGG